MSLKIDTFGIQLIAAFVYLGRFVCHGQLSITNARYSLPPY